MKRRIICAAFAASVFMSSCAALPDGKKISGSKAVTAEITGSGALTGTAADTEELTDAAYPDVITSAADTAEESAVTCAEDTGGEETEAGGVLPAEETGETAAESGTAVIAFAGDVTQSDVFGEITDYLGTSYCLNEVRDIFSSADIAFVNLETSVSDRGTSEKKEGYGFRSDPDKLEVFTSAGIDIVSAANNHVRDFGTDALGDTFENLEKYGLEYVGAGRNIGAAEKLSIFEVNGLKIGFTACSSVIENMGWFAGEDRAGINCVIFGEESAEAYLERIGEYDKMCDVLLVSVHWGVEYLHGVTYEQQQFARRLCDSGADIILGHHPHVLEPIESYNGSVIFYSLGNFLFYKMDDDAGKTAIFTVEVDKNGFVSGKMQPVFIEDRKTYLLGSGSGMYGEIIGLVNEMSAGLGVRVSENGDIITEG